MKRTVFLTDVTASMVAECFDDVRVVRTMFTLAGATTVFFIFCAPPLRQVQ